MRRDVLTVKKQVKLARARADAYARNSDDISGVVLCMSDSATAERLRRVAKPPDPSKSLKKAGIVLLAVPDPISGVPGAALVGAAYAMKSKEPLSAESVVKEARRTLRDLQSLF